MAFWKAFLLTLLVLAVLGGFFVSLRPAPPTLQESTSSEGGNATPEGATGNATGNATGDATGNATGNATSSGAGNVTLTPPVT